MRSRELERLKNQISRHIGTIIETVWLDGYGRAKVKIKEDLNLGGATNAIFFKAHTAMDFVVKYHFEDVPRDKDGYEVLVSASPNLKKHLVKPLFIKETGLPVLLTPYLQALTLHQVIVERRASNTWLLNQFYKDFLKKMYLLWEKTR
jgi:hypothetical protein